MKKFKVAVLGIFLFFSLSNSVLANDFSPSAGTKIVLDNIKGFPDYVFFISTANDECEMVQLNIRTGTCSNNINDCMTKQTSNYKHVHRSCNLKIFGESGILTNAYLTIFGYVGQCDSPVYAIKKESFNEAEFRKMNVCEQSDFLSRSARKITSDRLSIGSASSWKVSKIEEHFKIDLNNVQEEPSYLVEKSYLSIYFAILSFIIITAVLLVRHNRNKKK